MSSKEKNSPFQPESPVRPENFEGRKWIINKNSPYLNQGANGTPTHFFIKGKRGMGKTSLADYFKNIVDVEYNMLTIHVLNDGVHDLDSLIQQIVERILNKVKTEKWGENIIHTIKKHIKSVEVSKVKIELRPDPENIKFIKDNFPFFLNDIIKNLDKNKTGLFIIIDDINGLAETPDFTNWYKSFADTISTEIRELPLVMILTTYPENAQKLYNYNASFNRIFKHIEIGELNNSEIENFFRKTFEEVKISVEDAAMDLMVKFSSGMPTMMQEIGEGVFWFNRDDVIDKNDTWRGILDAGDAIGEKHIRPTLDKSIRSKPYLTILKALGNDFMFSNIEKEYTFRKKEFMPKLNKREQNAFPKFLKRAKDLNIIEYASTPNNGIYKFSNNLYPVYFFIEANTNSNKP